MRRRKRKTWKFSESWFGQWLEKRRGIRERFCPTCHQPYLTAPEAKPEEQFVSGSAVAMVYSNRNFGRLNRLVRLGRFRANRNHLDCVRLFEESDLDDLKKVIIEARCFIEAKNHEEREALREKIRAAR